MQAYTRTAPWRILVQQTSVHNRVGARPSSLSQASAGWGALAVALRRQASLAHPALPSHAGGKPQSSRSLAWVRAATLGGAAFFTGLSLRENPARCEAAVLPAAPVTSTSPEPSLWSKCLAEALGTAIIVQGGCGVAAAAKYCSSNVGSGVGAFVWGVSVALAVYATRDVSGAHLNPAITASLAVNKPDDFPVGQVLPYISAQILGAFGAGAVNYLVCRRGIAAFEAAENIVRGSAASIASYSGAFGMTPNLALTSPLGALAMEIWMTAVFAFLVYAATDKNSSVPEAAAPVLVGAAVVMMIATFAPITGCGMNPARDLGPRLVTAVAGWGGAAWTSWWVYSLGPILGAVLGGAAYQVLLAPAKQGQ